MTHVLEQRVKLTVTLSVGTQLGAYEIIGQLGAGGMGEVYRATDTKLGREVAIKTLPSALAQDRDRLARFEREAKLLAALNHSHIAAIYGLDEHAGTQYLAMELVEGQTLEEKLKAGRLPVEDSLGLALQIAEALEAAHEKGVVHRDLKPANIMITRDGVVKVLDFGLAKAVAGDPNEPSPAHSPALSLAMTQQGLVLGTAGYMSPEQASGQATDQRSDIWAFGVVLYEMLTGLPLFSGESVPHILAAVLQTEPDWNRLPKNLHPRLKLLLERCLKKKVRDRYHSIADVRVDIEEALRDPQGVSAAVALSQPSRWRALPVATGLVAGALIAGVAVWSLTRPAPPIPARVTRFLVTPPPTAPLTSAGGTDIAISRDGTRLAYLGRNVQSDRVGLYLRDFDSLETRLITGTEVGGVGNMNAFFSADGSWIGFNSGQGITRVAINGGPPLKILDGQPAFVGATAAADGTLIYASLDGLYRVSAGGGGIPERLTPESEDGIVYIAPALLPGDRAVLFHRRDSEAQRVAVLDLQSGEQELLIDGGHNASYAATGHIVFARGTTLMAVPFDLEQLAVTGEPVAVVQGVRFPGTGSAADYALSASGTLVYVPAAAETAATGALVWVDRNGRVTEQALDELVENPRSPRLSPDGQRLALTTGPGTGDLWIYDFGGRPPIPLAIGGGDNPTWSPDGTEVAFRSIVNIYTAPADASMLDPSPVANLLASAGALPQSWSAEGELIVATLGGDVLATRVEPGAELREVLATADAEGDASLSPNGRWLAYVSDRTGRAEIWVKGYPEGIPVRVSRDGGYEPRWSADGRELFYLQGNAMMSVAVETEGQFSFETAVELFDEPYFSSGESFINSYDVALDGRFLMIQRSASATEAPGSSSIVVVENWFEELERLVPTQ